MNMNEEMFEALHPKIQEYVLASGVPFFTWFEWNEKGGHSNFWSKGCFDVKHNVIIINTEWAISSVDLNNTVLHELIHWTGVYLKREAINQCAMGIPINRNLQYDLLSDEESTAQYGAYMVLDCLNIADEYIRDYTQRYLKEYTSKIDFKSKAMEAITYLDNLVIKHKKMQEEKQA